MTVHLAGTPLSSALRRHLRSNITVAVGDGVGAPHRIDDGTSLWAVLSSVAREIGGIRLVLGWLPSAPTGIEADAFADIVALMPGWGVRDVLTAPNARFVPARLSATPAMLRDILRPAVLLARLVRRGNMFHFSTEVSWQRGLVDAGTPVLAIIEDDAPCADAGPPLPSDAVHVVGCSVGGPATVDSPAPEPIHQALAARQRRDEVSSTSADANSTVPVT
ncbi:acetyl-CoA hydrolase/transferase [Mycolicibacterium thermoresistibile]|uniref:Putative acetyl-CoA hydrolase/transferase n=1 Tax=Mycolicibacterium thermoresistibile TaxID=1797 RepID=A0A100XIG2_MYCTH|nr:putative acetyl-CoA hydrolase/transferase [Mycolicibacterium thermoresistibile]SNW19630.1 acetyl-CoA hydrolase/transferase [Mycolicibacterium thermoresistibile]